MSGEGKEDMTSERQTKKPDDLRRWEPGYHTEPNVSRQERERIAGENIKRHRQRAEERTRRVKGFRPEDYKQGELGLDVPVEERRGYRPPLGEIFEVRGIVNINSFSLSRPDGPRRLIRRALTPVGAAEDVFQRKEGEGLEKPVYVLAGGSATTRLEDRDVKDYRERLKTRTHENWMFCYWAGATPNPTVEDVLEYQNNIALPEGKALIGIDLEGEEPTFRVRKGDREKEINQVEYEIWATHSF